MPSLFKRLGGAPDNVLSGTSMTRRFESRSSRAENVGGAEKETTTSERWSLGSVCTTTSVARRVVSALAGATTDIHAETANQVAYLIWLGIERDLIETWAPLSLPTIGADA